MKYFFLISVLVSFSGLSQTWQSLNYSLFNNVRPYGQFVVNQYTNDIWLINDNKVGVIENSGNFQYFDYTNLGSLYTGDHMRFAFTPDSIFYKLDYVGLFGFTNYNSVQMNNELYINNILTDGDTLFISRDGTLLKYLNGTYTDTYCSPVNPVVKNGFLYLGSNHFGHIVSYLSEYFFTDPQYLLANVNDKKFKRYSDSIYVGTEKGIMFAYNYDILDTITPNNSVNMPSANVLEIEFDKNDSLWAVFGDSNGTAFSIAKLEGNSWTNVFNSTNSPINFLNFKGIEFDTLGNMWVADVYMLHTLLSPNSPQWLSNEEIVNDEKNLIYPNPTNGNISISTPSDIIKVAILDMTGSIINTIDNPHVTIDLSSLSKGVYFILIETVQRNSLERFVKE